MLRALLALVLLSPALATSTAAAQNAPTPARPRRDPCAGVTCGGHGVCVPEVEEAFCFCDEGYAATGTTCAASQRRAPVLTSSSMGLTVVQIAIAEDGHDLAHVGGTRSLAPGPLRQYVRPGGLWCSDFVSWVYRAAGVPFTGGYEGGWMLPNNAAIRRWFERQHAWIGRGPQDFGTFQPRPGDYVRISTPTWNHSAIVRYVEGSTLHTVEGNAGNRVILTRYPRWRQDRHIEGFGLVTMAAARMRATEVTNVAVTPR